MVMVISTGKKQLPTQQSIKRSRVSLAHTISSGIISFISFWTVATLEGDISKF